MDEPQQPETETTDDRDNLDEFAAWFFAQLDPNAAPAPTPLPAAELDDEDDDWLPPPRLDDSWRGGSTMSRPHWRERHPDDSISPDSPDRSSS
jgi:hypothetical protein